jgi:acetyl esterase/lipase
MGENLFGEDFSWRLWPESGGGEDLLFEARAPVEDLVISDVIRPRCFMFRPQRSNGRAALVLAGGGYTKLVIGKGGVEVAQWLSSLGIHAFMLAHRFPCARHALDGRSGSQAPVDDAIEAMRQIRARAGEWNLDPNGIGVVGLSSGGHLASCLVSRYPDHWRAPDPAHAPVSSRPDFLVVGYAPISTNAAGRTVIVNKPPLPPPEKQALYEAMQPDVQLLDFPPPAFIVYSANDDVVPVENAYRLHRALIAKGGEAELHVFADAPHGFALRERVGPVAKWPELCAAWLRSIA